MERVRPKVLTPKEAFSILLWGVCGLVLIVTAVFVSFPINIVLLVAGLVLLVVFIRKVYLVGRPPTGTPLKKEYEI